MKCGNEFGGILIGPTGIRASYWAESALATILEPEEQLVFLTKFQRILNEGIFDCDLVLRALKTFLDFCFGAHVRRWRTIRFREEHGRRFRSATTVLVPLLSVVSRKRIGIAECGEDAHTPS